MKNINLFLVALVFLFACKQNFENDISSPVEEKVIANFEEKEVEDVPEIQPVLASWVGMFIAEEYDANTDYTYSNLINISIEEINGSQVKGHSVVAGNLRPFEGTMDKTDNTLHFLLKEPGDDQYDGVFEFWMNLDSTIVGRWEAYNKTLKVTKRKYNLTPKVFSYNPENSFGHGNFIDLGRYKDIVQTYDYEEYYDREIATVTQNAYKWNASTQLIPEKEIANMKKGDLQIIRNTIYARHGYSFKNKIYRTIFDQAGLDWYVPVSINIEANLTEIELQNIELIKRYEDYAEDFYDSFGR